MWEREFRGCSSNINGKHRTDLDRQHLKGEVYKSIYQQMGSFIRIRGLRLDIIETGNVILAIKITSLLTKRKIKLGWQLQKIVINAMWSHLCLTKIADPEMGTDQQGCHSVFTRQGIIHLYVHAFNRWRRLDSFVRAQLVSELNNTVTKWLRWTEAAWAIF